MIKLFKHQQEALEQTEQHNRVAYYLDMGLGKTYVASEKMKELNAQKNLVVVQLSKVDDWTNHFKEHYDYKVYNLRNKKEMEKFLNEDEQSIGIINYDLTWRRPELRKLRDFTLILDESTHVKSYSAKRTRFIMNLKYENVILLSGTPVSGKYEEIWTQVLLLGWNIRKKDFYNRYVITHSIDVGGFPIDIITGYKNVDELKAKLAEYGAVFMKTEEVVELPKQIETDVNVKASSQYRKFHKTGYIDLGDEELIGDYTLTQMLGERQLTGIYSKEKHTAFKDLVESTNDRLIVFYNFTKEYEIMKGLIGDRPYSVINGSKRDLTAYEDKDNSITFVQYQAGSQGLNLQKANKTIYFTPPLSVEHFMQSKKRTHRIKQDKSCFYYFMKCTGTVEDKIYAALHKGQDYTNKLFEKDLTS